MESFFAKTFQPPFFHKVKKKIFTDFLNFFPKKTPFFKPKTASFSFFLKARSSHDRQI
jgi:hypothetical protein